MMTTRTRTGTSTLTRTTSTLTKTKNRTSTTPARIALFLSLAAAMLAGGSGVAAAAPKRLGVVTFRGPGEGATRNVVMRSGKISRYQIIGGQQIAKVAHNLKVSLDANDGFQAVAKELGISAFVTGEVSKKKATLTVRDGSDGSVTAEASWKGPNPRKLSQIVAKTFWKRLGSAIDRGKAPSGAKQAVVAQEEAAPETGAEDSGGADDDDKDKDVSKSGGQKAAADDSSSKTSSGDRDRRSAKKTKSSGDSDSDTTVSAKSEPETPGVGRPEALMVFVGPRIMSRSLTYTDNKYMQNSKYSLAAAPELALDADFYPMALSSSGFISDLGLTASVGYMLPVVTTPALTGTGSYKTYSLNWSLGAKVRLPYGLTATVAYGDQNYQLIAPSNGGGIEVPKVDYRYVRIGAGERTHVTPEITVMANLAYLQCLSLGGAKGGITSSTYFPKAKGAALEIGVGAGYRISSLLEVQAGVEMRRYGLAFHETVADQVANPNLKIAGGAVDQYLMGWVGAAVILDGGPASGGHHGEDQEAASDKSGDDEKGGDKSDDKKDKDEDSEDK